MEGLNNIKKEYLKTLTKRSKESKVYKPFQSTGLMLADILDDPENKAIYIRLSKIYDNQELIIKARDVAERRNITNKGAYFMKMLKDIRKLEREKFTYKTKAKKISKLRLGI